MVKSLTKIKSRNETYRNTEFQAEVSIKLLYGIDEIMLKIGINVW